MFRKQHQDHDGTLGKCPLKPGERCDGDDCAWWMVKANYDYESCALHSLAFDVHDVAWQTRMRTER